jgi:hypothetical protein
MPACRSRPLRMCPAVARAGLQAGLCASTWRSGDGTSRAPLQAGRILLRCTPESLAILQSVTFWRLEALWSFHGSVHVGTFDPGKPCPARLSNQAPSPQPTLRHEQRPQPHCSAKVTRVQQMPPPRHARRKRPRRRRIATVFITLIAVAWLKAAAAIMARLYQRRFRKICTYPRHRNSVREHLVLL